MLNREQAMLDAVNVNVTAEALADAMDTDPAARALLSAAWDAAMAEQRLVDAMVRVRDDLTRQIELMDRRAAGTASVNELGVLQSASFPNAAAGQVAATRRHLAQMAELYRATHPETEQEKATV